MAKTFSTMPHLGKQAPFFQLMDTLHNKLVSLHEFQDKPGLLIMFLCNHCPYVVHVQESLVALCKTFQDQGLGVVAISANDPIQYPQDAPEQMKIHGRKHGFTFPYLFDATQEVAKAYQAACTPDFFLFDQNHALFYRGQMDDSRPGNGKPNDGADLRKAVEALLAGGKPLSEQKPSMGCNIKWR